MFPRTPHILTTRRKSLPILSNLTTEVKTLDENWIKDEGVFEQKVEK